MILSSPRLVLPLRFGSFLLLLVLMSMLYACTAGDDLPARTSHKLERDTILTVFAAASLTDAFADIKEAFERSRPGIDVLLNLAGSQQLAQQLRMGAPADVFASASPQQMDSVVESGRIKRDAPLPFARNRLTVIVPAKNRAGIERLQDLAQPGLRIVVAADVVPVGRYTREFLEKASRKQGSDPGYATAVRKNIASLEQNVRAVLTKVVLDEADAGVVYASDLKGRPEIGTIPIPEALNSIAVYPIAAIGDSKNADLAWAFIEYVRSHHGQAILSRHGFAPSHAS